jgi:hypothetical protein
MRLVASLVILASVYTGPASTARFSVDGVTSLPTPTLATVEPRNGAPSYSWLRVYFYASAEAANRARAASPRELTKTNWSAVLQLTVDKERIVWQVDLSLPGHTCTIAASDGEARNVLQMFQFDGTRVRLQSRGSHVCDMRSLKIANQTFEWNVDLDLPVANSAP